MQVLLYANCHLSDLIFINIQGRKRRRVSHRWTRQLQLHKALPMSSLLGAPLR